MIISKLISKDILILINVGILTIGITLGGIFGSGYCFFGYFGIFAVLLCFMLVVVKEDEK